MKTSSTKILIVNGRPAYIFADKSNSEQKNEAIKWKKSVVKILNEFLKNAEHLYRYGEGFTTSKTLTSYDEPRLKIKRMANPIGEIRKKLPKAFSMFTFRYSSDEDWKYGIEITDASIKFMKNLKASIEAQINS